MELPYPDDAEVAFRVRALCEAEGFGDNMKAWAAKLHISYTSLNNVSNGLPLSKRLAIQLCQKIPGLSTDYLWFGDLGSINGRDLRDRLSAAETSLRASQS